MNVMGKIEEEVEALRTRELEYVAQVESEARKIGHLQAHPGVR